MTHLTETGEPAAQLMAKSRYRCRQTLQRYARPGPEAIVAMTARRDPSPTVVVTGRAAVRELRNDPGGHSARIGQA